VRRGLGRGRTLIVIGAILAIIGIPLPWLTVGGIILPARTANGFEGPGVIVFLAAVAMLAVVVLPYAARTRRSSVDRSVVYLGILMVGVSALVVQVIDLISTEGNRLMPLEAPGMWLSIVGMAIATWGVLELFAEKEPAP
jgi:hypothetical protein